MVISNVNAALKGVLKVKCPYCIRDGEPSSAPYIQDGQLLTTHAYYYQVQTQLFVCSADYADFVVVTFCNSDVNFSIQRILEYFIWRVTVLLEHLDCAFSICSCLLLYNLLIFNYILLSIGKSRFLWLFHLPSKFKIILPCCLCDIGDFLNTQYLSCNYHQAWVRLHISVVSYTIDF